MKLNNLFKKQASLSINALILAGILIVLNFLSYQIFFALDLTQNKEYSISNVSKTALGKLDDLVNIKAYFSADLPSQYVNLPQAVKDTLDEYRKYSKGKVRYEFIDPKDNQELAQELQIKGVPQLQFNVLEKDKYQVVNGYLGMTISYGDKTEVIPVIQDTGNLEYEITSKIKKVTAKVTPVVGFVTSNGTLDTEKEIGQAYKSLGALYEVETVDLETAKAVPERIKTLIIAGAKEEFSREELEAIDKFLMKGGSLLVLADGVSVNNSLQASVNQSRLDGLLVNYGIKLNQDLVLDNSAGVASFNQGFVIFNINYPFWPKVLKAGLDKDNATVSRLESLILPWVSSIEIDKGKIDPSDKISYLVKSSDKSWTQAEPFNLNPQQNFSSAKTAQYNLAVAVSGKFKSAYGSGSTDSGRIVVVGDSDFLRDNMLGGGDHLVFFNNLVDSLTLDEDLIGIRSKVMASRPIKELEPGRKALMRYLNVFGLTALVITFGLWRHYARRRSRLVDEI